MAKRGIQLPAKLTRDAIVEALLEIRFDMKTLPEVLFGRLASYAPWQTFQQKPMSAYNVPAPMREADVNLRYQPIFELVSDDRTRAVRIGSHVLSFHVMAPYIGWTLFKTELENAVHQLFSSAEDLTVRRIGLRYTNALTPNDHGIRSINDLDVAITIAEERILGSVNLNFMTDLSDNTRCTVRVATKDFVGGAIPEDTTIIIDVDVFTKDSFKTKTIADVQSWIEFAHEKEKVEFFHLLPRKAIDALKEA